MEKYQDNPYKKSGKYTKLKEGKTTLRFFDYISGWEVWIDGEKGRKVIRKKEITELPEKLRPMAKYFRAFRVYNYDEDATQVFVATQRTILEPLSELYFDTDWGQGESLSDFDITISRKGEKLETEYLLTPKPKKPFDKELDKVELKALYDNGDPWGDDIKPATEEEVEELTKDFDEMLGDLDGDLPNDR